MNHICLDGRILPADEPALLVNNRSYRYGDGLFETMKVKAGKILLGVYHFERLFASLARLDYEVPALLTTEWLENQVVLLCEKNDCRELARVRLSISRGNGNLADADKLQYLIECWPLGAEVEQLNQRGFAVDIYPHARKNFDQFSDIKSVNYMPYVMAARFAKKNKLDDALVMNCYDRIVEASVANIFLVKDDKLFTPSLSEGCIAGVMRRWLLEKCHTTETTIYYEDLFNADELFLSNAIYGIRWVQRLRDKVYTNRKASAIHNMLRQDAWA